MSLFGWTSGAMPRSKNGTGQCLVDELPVAYMGVIRPRHVFVWTHASEQFNIVRVSSTNYHRASELISLSCSKYSNNISKQKNTKIIVDVFFWRRQEGLPPTELLLLKHCIITKSQALDLGYEEGNKENHENYTKLFSHWSDIGWKLSLARSLTRANSLRKVYLHEATECEDFWRCCHSGWLKWLVKFIVVRVVHMQKKKILPHVLVVHALGVRRKIFTRAVD